MQYSPKLGLVVIFDSLALFSSQASILPLHGDHHGLANSIVRPKRQKQPPSSRLRGVICWSINNKDELFHVLHCLKILLCFLVTIEKDYEIPRNNVLLGAIIGEGQFGDVHRGIIKSMVSHYSTCTFLYKPGEQIKEVTDEVTNLSIHKLASYSWLTK